MGSKQDQKRKGLNLRSIWKLLLAIIGVVAIVQELQKPADERTWHGKVGGFVPYDFRPPTAERFRETYWNPDGPIISSQVFGAGWALNLGALKKKFVD